MRGLIFILLGLLFSPPALALSVYVSEADIERFAKEADDLSDPHGRATPALQNLIFAIQTVYGPRMSTEVFEKFQTIVGRHGGKLLSTPVMPTEGEPYWLREKHRLHDFQSSQELPSEVDVIIVGAGLTGLGAAYELIQNYRAMGLKVLVLEAGGVAEGATGHNGGNVQPSPENFLGTYEGLLEERYKYLKKRNPKFSEKTLRAKAQEQALLLLRIGQMNGKLFRQIAQNEKVEADLSLKGWLRLANSLADVISLAKDVALARAQGIDTEMWDSARIKKESGIDTDLAGRFTPGYGNYHPYKFVTQVFEKLLERGLLLFSQTRVLKIDWSTPVDQPLNVHTTRGIVRAKKVILATDAYTSKLIPELFMVEPFQSQILTFEHLLDQLNGRTLTEQHGDLYYNAPMSSQYVGEDGLPRMMLLIGGGPDRYVMDADAPKLYQDPFDVVVSQTNGRFPETFNQPVSVTWTGVFGFTPDRLPILDFVFHDGFSDPRITAFTGSQGYGGGMCLIGGASHGSRRSSCYV
jgi:glycine/D-amino acid oxidase-like deaminating enzyme